MKLLRPAPAARLEPPSRADKARRLVWHLAWLFGYRLVPVPLFGVRRAILRLFGARIGRGARAYPSARIWAPWNLAMGPNSCLAARVECYNVAPVVLQEGAVVSQGAHLCSASHDVRTDDFALVGAPVVVGRGAWVAADAFLGPGVTLGERAVAGARAVVMRSVPAGIVVAGNPARPIGTRESGVDAPASGPPAGAPPTPADELRPLAQVAAGARTREPATAASAPSLARSSRK